MSIGRDVFMLRILGNPRQFCDGITRRDAMTVGGISVLGGMLNLPGVMALEERRPAEARVAEARPGRARNVMVLYLHGGAPTQDMFDLKPQAPVEMRGEFRPIATNVPGMQICEHLPRMSRWMHRCAIVRSVHHRAGCHNTLPSFSGSEQPVDINEPTPRDSFPPGMGAICEFLKPRHVDIPHYVALPSYLGWGFALKRPGPWGGFLGKRFDPVCSECKPRLDPAPPAGRRPMWLGTPFLADTALGQDITIDRLDTRRSLLQQFDGVQRQLEAGGGTFDRVRQRAFGLLTGSRLKTAFNLNAEDPRLRERYGNHLFGSSALLGRRLIEAGVRFVDVYWDGYAARVSTNLDPYWDTHSSNFVQLREVNLPNLDQTFDALMHDLEQRGLLDETLLVMMSDFGRTPRVNASAGRDHWTSCYSVLLAGAGIRGGTICGASDGHAAYVKDRPIRPADICATIYHCLGIDPDTTVPDRAGRPLAISHGGEPIREVLA
ncbi:MAG: DUF1501 domain-containing protein [Planctomycetes bacterium]|nr:DUF1501 domain-containing protein [Planctomycetota bacterium]